MIVLKFAISNIAWQAENDRAVYEYMQTSEFAGLEAAPTRLFAAEPYAHTAELRELAASLREEYGLTVCSLQSIWYGRTEQIFGTAAERAALLDYTKEAIRFAVAGDCGNLVFGCPKNRSIHSAADIAVGIEFFRAIGEYAAEQGTVVALEANPDIYGTNWLNHTDEAVAFCREVASPGIRVNFDLGTVIHNGEDLTECFDNIELVNHVHISEPYLKRIEQRSLHRELLDGLRDAGYDRFVSVEMGTQDNVADVYRTIDYVSGL